MGLLRGLKKGVCFKPFNKDRIFVRYVPQGHRVEVANGSYHAGVARRLGETIIAAADLAESEALKKDREYQMAQSIVMKRLKRIRRKQRRKL